ncbi:MAG: hypothetical protein K940chlam3_01329 [Chlamydiae bacterium]|nr:hypothetical protein [Chlamydiota bacterium]
MFNQNDEETFKKMLKEIERQNESFGKEKQKVFEELGISPSEVHEALKDSSQYSVSDWEKLQALRKQMDEEMQRGLDNIRDPEKAQKAYDSRNLPPWALFCR